MLSLRATGAPWPCSAAGRASLAGRARRCACGGSPRAAVRLQRRRELALRPRARSGLFSHTYNPHYFINPPAFSYLLHVVFDAGSAARAGVGQALRDRPHERLRRRAAASRRCSAPPRSALLTWPGARLFDRRGRADRGARCWPSRSCRCFYSHLALNDVPALAPVCLALLGVGDVYRRTARATTRRRARPRPGLRDQVHGRDRRAAARSPRALADAGAAAPRSAGCCWPACWRWRASSSPTRTRCSTSTRSATGLSHQSEASATAAASSGLDTTPGSSTTLELTWGLGWVPRAGRARRRARAARLARPRGWRSCSSRRRSCSWSSWAPRTASSARWLLPVFPLLCLLAGVGGGRARRSGSARACAAATRGASPACSARCCARRGSSTRVHIDACCRATTPASSRATGWSRTCPTASKVVVEPIVPDAWAADARRASARARGNGFALDQVADHARAPTTPGGGGVIQHRGLRAHHPPGAGRLLRPRRLLLGRDGLDPVRARLAEPGEVPQARSRYYAALERDAELVYEVRPVRRRRGPVPFNYRLVLRRLPAGLRAAGPRGRIYRLCRRPVLSQPYPRRAHRDRAPRRPTTSISRAPIELAERGRGRTSPEPDGRRRGRPRRRGAGRGLPRRLRRAARRASRRCARAANADPPGRRCTSRWSPAATRARRRRAPTRSSRPASPASWSPPTTRPRRPPAAASGSCATRASRSRSPTASSRPARGCSTSRSASTRAPGRPWVLFKSAMTLDGKVATRTGDSKWISGDDSRRARAPLARGVRRRRVRHRHRARRRPAAHRPHRATSTASRAGSCSTPRRACRWTPR